MTDLVIGNEIIRAHPLNLGRAQHPADIVDDLNVGCGCLFLSINLIFRVNLKSAHLLQLQEFCSLHKMLQLQSSFRHVVRLAPFFNARDVVLNLHRCIARVSHVIFGLNLHVPLFHEQKFLRIKRSLKLVTPISFNSSVMTCCTTDSSMK